MVMQEQEEDGDWVRRSARMLFEESPNPRMNKIGYEPEEKEAKFESGKVFFGWSIASSKELEQLKKKARRRTKTENDAKKAALRKLKKNIRKRSVEDGQPFYLDRSSPDVAFIGGERGSGKSFILRAMTNRSAKTDVKHIYIDIENEYYSNNVEDGIQKRLMTLRDAEERQNIKTKVLMPEFVYQARKQKSMPERGYQYMDRFKFGFDILDADDIDFLLREKFGDHPDIDNFGSEMERVLEEEGFESWQQIKDVAERMSEQGDFDYHRRDNQIQSYIKNNYEKWDFLGADKKVDLAEIFNGNEDEYDEDEEIPEEDKGYDAIALVLHGGGAIPSKLKMKELYVAFLIKRLRNLKERGKISQGIRFSVDEAHNFIPAHTEPDFPPSKKQIRQVIKQDRKRQFSLNMATQEPGDVQSKNFLSQSRHLFIPQNMRPRPRKHLLKEGDLYKSGDMQRNKWSYVFDPMDRFQWFVANIEKGEWHVVEPASPLANHRTS